MPSAEPSDSRPRSRVKPAPVRVGRTRVGKGIFAGQTFRASEIVGEITGEVIEDPDYGSDYCFNIGEGLQLEPIAPFRFVNHSCEPNCEFDSLECSEFPGGAQRTRVFLFALRDIKRGEELCIDYNWPVASAIRCRCQAPSCRGWVVSADDLADALQNRNSPV